MRLKQIGDIESVDMDEDALQAIIKLAEGDMRKCLNVLQSCHMSYDRVTRQNVYLCTGAPLPEEIEKLLGILLNEPFSVAYKALKKSSLVAIFVNAKEMQREREKKKKGD